MLTGSLPELKCFNMRPAISLNAHQNNAVIENVADSVSWDICLNESIWLLWNENQELIHVVWSVNKNTLLLCWFEQEFFFY